VVKELGSSKFLYLRYPMAQAAWVQIPLCVLSFLRNGQLVFRFFWNGRVVSF